MAEDNTTVTAAPETTPPVVAAPESVLTEIEQKALAVLKAAYGWTEAEFKALAAKL